MINSYILDPNAPKSGDLLENPRKYFILDLKYLNGAIVIEYCGSTIMDYRYWDLVDQLWMYFIHLMGEVDQSGGKARCFSLTSPSDWGWNA